MNETVFCELKLGLRLTSGDVRSPGRERGTRVHEEVEDAIATLPMPSVKSLEEARALQATGSSVIIPEMYMSSAGHAVDGIPDLMIWGKRLDVFELKSGVAPKRPHRRLGTRAFESDAIQVLVYGMLAEERLGVDATLWVVYGAEDLLDDIRTTAVARGRVSEELERLLKQAKPIHVPFTAENRQHALAVIARAQEIKRAPQTARRSHQVVARCRVCVFGKTCQERLSHA